MFRSYGTANGGGGGGPSTVTSPTATNGNQTGGSGKDTSSLFFNQIESNLRSWHSTNYCLPPPTSPPPTIPPHRTIDHGVAGGRVGPVIVRGGTTTDSGQSSLAHNITTTATTTTSRSQSQALGQNQQLPSYDNVLRMMMSTTTIGLTKATNQNRSNGNLFDKYYFMSGNIAPRLSIKYQLIKSLHFPTRYLLLQRGVYNLVWPRVKT